MTSLPLDYIRKTKFVSASLASTHSLLKLMEQGWFTMSLTLRLDSFGI